MFGDFQGYGSMVGKVIRYSLGAASWNMLEYSVIQMQCILFPFKIGKKDQEGTKSSYFT